MPKIAEQASVPHTAAQMYALVCDVEHYSDFVPSCIAGQTLSVDGDKVTAKLSFEKAGITQQFTTENIQTPDQRIQMQLLDGPFKYLRGEWVFSDNEQGSQVDFSVDFEFNNMMLKMMLQPMFAQIMTKIVSAFSQRADAVYG
jgi:ribosome-associated toxin RatA of RatAB toxin-antitoxin module